jgi:hypothetical protein
MRLATMLCLSCTFLPAAQPIAIRKLSLGMDIDAARSIMVTLLGKDWDIGPVGKPSLEGGSASLVGDVRNGKSLVGELGFTLSENNGFTIASAGLISANPKTRKVTRFAFDEALTNAVFGSRRIRVSQLYEQFRSHYGLPEFMTFRLGWTYQSPDGYKITFLTDKFFELKDISNKNEKDPTEEQIEEAIFD